jgi:two-component system, chemotaxis family, chemotaxis protein CheY
MPTKPGFLIVVKTHVSKYKTIMKKKVLVVDDSLYMRTLIKDALSDAGFEVIGMAATGEAAIDMALELQPDIITLDNILPDMLGIDILKVFREEDMQSKVVMISAVGQQSVVNEGLGLGASDYIVKPFTAEQLVAAIRKIA